jgi:hypothetical protein
MERERVDVGLIKAVALRKLERVGVFEAMIDVDVVGEDV